MIKYLFKGLGSISAVSAQQHGLKWQTFKNYSWAFCQRPDRVPPPVEIQLEPSTRCNLQCRMCTLDKNVKGDVFLTRANFEHLLQQLVPLKTINFTGLGESLLNLELEYFIARARKVGIETNFVTNGLLLTEPRIANLIRAGLNKLSISIESVSPEVYQRLRGVTFNQLAGNIDRLVHQVQCTQSPLLLGFNVVLLPDNISHPEEIYRLIDWAAEHRIDFISFQNLHHAVHSAMRSYFMEQKGQLNKLFRSLQSYARAKRVAVSLPSLHLKQRSCYYPWVYPFITAGGELLPCCVIPQFDTYQKIVDEFSLGNIFTYRFQEIWNNARAVSFRRSLKTHPHHFCRQCSKYLNIL